MPKRVYLFELDSVRSTDEEIIAAQKALYDEIVGNGNIVALTYNQIVDSRGFFSLFSDPEYQENILALFREGYLQISQFGEVRTVTQYLIGAMEQEKEFIFSALPIRYTQKHLMALVKRSLVYSDLSELAGYLDGGSRTTEERRALFEETGNTSAPMTDDELKKVLENLYGLLVTVQQISIMDAVYIPPRDPAEYAGLHMKDFLRTVLTLEMPDDPLWENAIEIIRHLDCLDCNNRSVYLRRIRAASQEHPREDCAPYQYAEAIVNLCVNYAYEVSICGVSRHYDTDELRSKGSDLQTFRSDLALRLAQSWNGAKRAQERFLLPENNVFTPFEDFSSLPDFSLAVRCAAYAPVKGAADKSEKQVKGYETGIERQRASHRGKLLRAAAGEFVYALLCLVIVCVFSMGIDLLQDILGISLIGSGAFGSIFRYLAFLFLAELVTWVISKLTRGRIDSLSESLGQMFRYLRDFFRISAADFGAYTNEGALGKNFSEPCNSTIPIDYITSGAMKKYRKLRSMDPSGVLFADPDAEEYPLADVGSPDVLKKLIRTEETAGVRFGVVFQSRYHLMVSDPVIAEDGTYFPYERVVPATVQAGAVALTLIGEKFLLVRQFRHALRAQQYAFVRGFAEAGETTKACALRELEEELGKADVKSISYLGECAPDSGLTSARCDIFCVQIESFRGAAGHEGILEYITLSAQELEEWIALGKINDSFTLASYALYRAGGAGTDSYQSQ